MRALSLVVCVVLSSSGFPARPALALESGSLSGVLTTSGGVPLPQVVLTLTHQATALSLVTGAEGRFRADGLTAGEYRLAAEAPGLVMEKDAVAVVVAGRETRVRPTLAPAPIREHVLVSATRGEAILSTLGTSATVLDREHLEARAPLTVLDALRDVPGLAVARAGGVGLQASAFVRGGESRFARILIDGVPINEPGGGMDFGVLLPLEIERIEVVRGAASSLYGTDALAGVVQLVTRRADPGQAPELRAAVEGGTFATRIVNAGTSGRARGWDWNLGALQHDTDNQERNSGLESSAGAASLGRRLGVRGDLRLLLRGQTSTVGTPGSTAFNRPDLDAYYDRSDLTAVTDLRIAAEHATHEWTLGLNATHQLSVDPEDSGPYLPTFDGRQGFAGSDWTNPAGFQNDTRRWSASYRAEVQVGRRQLVTLGSDVERESGDIGDRGGDLLSPRRTSLGGFVQDRIVVGERAFLTLGGRAEHNGSYGWAAVPRASLAVRLRSGPHAMTARMSAGAGIKEPSFLESFGVSMFTKGNPALAPERSRTWDVGLEQRLAAGRIRLATTLFHHSYLDQIAYFVESYDPYLGTYRNLGRTRARGVEASLEAAPMRRLRLSADYTYLDGKILASASDGESIYGVGKPLLRRPKHQGSLSASGDWGRFAGGATYVVVGRRADSDFAGLGLTANGGYARVDAHLRSRLTPAVELFAVGENLLDRRYMEVLGYPALGRSVRAGLRIHAARASTEH